jgi:hypothetical protein
MSQDKFVVLSADKYYRTEDQNRACRALLGRLLHGVSLPGWLGVGHYDGSTEECTYVRLPVDPIDCTRALWDLRCIGTELDQESILVVDIHGAARLEFLADGAIVDLGQWTEVEDTEDYIGWTCLGGKCYSTTGSLKVAAEAAA